MVPSSGKATSPWRCLLTTPYEDVTPSNTSCTLECVLGCPMIDQTLHPYLPCVTIFLSMPPPSQTDTVFSLPRFLYSMAVHATHCPLHGCLSPPACTVTTCTGPHHHLEPSLYTVLVHAHYLMPSSPHLASCTLLQAAHPPQHRPFLRLLGFQHLMLSCPSMWRTSFPV